MMGFFTKTNTNKKEELFEQESLFKKAISFNPQNFAVKANDKRYSDFLNRYMLKLADSETKAYLSRILESDAHSKYLSYGKTTINIPEERETLQDEMTSIYEITKLIHLLAVPDYTENSYDLVIPTFNVYHYLQLMHSFYSQMYLELLYSEIHKYLYMHNDSVDSDEINDKIIAYQLLTKKADDYDINYLNRLNCKDYSVRTLEKKGFRI